MKQSDIQNLQASLTMERDARFREENNVTWIQNCIFIFLFFQNNSTHSKAIAERDLLKKDCLNLKNREEQFRREVTLQQTVADFFKKKKKFFALAEKKRYRKW